MEVEPQPAAPAVVAVVVTCDPGSWFEPGLSSLANQDYPNLSVLVIDSASEVDPTPRVAAVIPGAFVMRLERRVGFGRAANEVLKRVEGASHLLFCHDDVVLAPDAVRCLLEEAFRSNAGIATPKYVQWDDPDRLLAVGATADKVGVVQDLVEPGELDQQQHDSVREVVRGTGWGHAGPRRPVPGRRRVQRHDRPVRRGSGPVVAGAGRRGPGRGGTRGPGSSSGSHPPGHPDGLGHPGQPASSRSASRRAPGPHPADLLPMVHLAWVLPLALLYMLGEAVTRLLQGRPGDAAHLVGSFGRGLSQPGQAVAIPASGPSAGARRVTVRSGGFKRAGNARLRAFLRERVDDVRAGLPLAAVAGRDGRHRRRSPTVVATAVDVVDAGSTASRAPAWTPSGTGESPAGPSTSDWQHVALVGAVLLGVLIFGSRSLLGHPLPAVAQLPNLSIGWSGLWRSWWSTWQTTGLGVTAPSSPALALLGVLATILFGAVGTLQHVVVLGPLLIGPLGAYRAARWWGSRRGRLAALIAYAVVPLPYNALARGHWEGLVAYAALPWVLAAIGRLSGELPFPVTRPERTGGRTVGLGLLVAVAAAAVPSLLYVIPLVGVALLAGSALTGRVRPGRAHARHRHRGHRGGGRTAHPLVRCGARPAGWPPWASAPVRPAGSASDRCCDSTPGP